MRDAGRIFRAVALSVGVITFIAAGLFTSKTAVAKSGHMSLKMPPENTRSKKGDGKEPDPSVSKRIVKQKQPPVTKTPSPGGPVAIPYPN